MEERELLIAQLEDIVRSGFTQLSDIKPSVWAELNIIMGKPYPGPLRYDKTPYTEEIINCAAPDHPARWIAVKKAAQIGFSATVIYAMICWMIKNNPGNTFLTVGAPDLIEKAMEKLDLFIDSCQLRPYIKPQVKRRKAQKSGDTNFKKEFAGGYVTVASAGNHRAIRQVDLQYGLFDDFESVKSASKESGSTRKLLEQRFASFADTMKMFMISTPELKESSNIEEAFSLGDQRKYHILCPCCGGMISLEWSVEVDILGEKIMAGIIWQTDDENNLIPGSVKYKCQMCAETFTERNKFEWLNKGVWIPMAKPSREGFYSYEINALYAYAGMFGWEHYVQDYIEANPPNQPVKEELMKTFTNVVLGQGYASASESPKATQIMQNTRGYDVGVVSEKTSLADGNGKIVLITLAADMNGKVADQKGGINDARIDWEIVAWAESGASYSVAHGWIGTFVPLEGSHNKVTDRTKWTYEENKPFSVWPVLQELMSSKLMTDTGREVGVHISALDTGHFTTYAYNFIDKMRQLGHQIRGIKGDKEEEYVRYLPGVPRFKLAQERADLYILKVGLIKDTLSEMMTLNWDEKTGEQQPIGFMNFPSPSNGLYQFKNYFEHYEAEHRTEVARKDGSGISMRWVKKKSTNQNHFFDCRVYNIAIKEIFTYEVGKFEKIKPFTWRDLATGLANRITIK